MSDDKNYRDAGTGEYVTEAYAERHPRTTVSEDRIPQDEIVYSPDQEVGENPYVGGGLTNQDPDFDDAPLEDETDDADD